MSTVSDDITAIAAQLTTVEGSITQLGTDLTDEIARLQAAIAAGSVTTADLANLKSINDRLTAVGTSLTGLDTQAKGA